MDNIWDRTPLKSEVIGRCSGNETTEWPRRTDKSRTLKKKKKKKKSLPLQLLSPLSIEIAPPAAATSSFLDPSTSHINYN